MSQFSPDFFPLRANNRGSIFNKPSTVYTHTHTHVSWFITHHNTFRRHTANVAAKLLWRDWTKAKKQTMSYCLLRSLGLCFPFHTLSTCLSLVSLLSASFSARPTLAASSLAYNLFTYFFFFLHLFPYLIMLFFLPVLFHYFVPFLLLSSSGVLFSSFVVSRSITTMNWNSSDAGCTGALSWERSEPKSSLKKSCLVLMTCSCR